MKRPMAATYAGSTDRVSAARVKRTAPVRSRLGRRKSSSGWRYAAACEGPNIRGFMYGISEPIHCPRGMPSSSTAFTASAPRNRPPRYSAVRMGDV